MTMQYFSSIRNGIKIAYEIYRSEQEKSAVLFLTGRAEYFLKYEHFFNDLNNAGITVYTMDHRGQGASERMLENQHKGHVEKFEFFVDDAEFFLKNKVLPSLNKGTPLFSVSHSMGGAVSFLLQNRMNLFSKIVFASPMWGINFGIFSEKLIYNLAGFLIRIGKAEDFVPGKKEYDFDTPFENNNLTHNRENFEKQIDFLKHNPDFALGGPTNKWVVESIMAMRKIRELSSSFTGSALLLQAGADTVVDNQTQNRILSKIKNSEKIIVENGWHELLNEEKNYYDQAVSHILPFLGC